MTFKLKRNNFYIGTSKMDIVDIYYENRGGWIALFKWQMCFKDTKIHRLYFSQRNGYTKGYMIGSWYFTFRLRSKVNTDINAQEELSKAINKNHNEYIVNNLLNHGKD